jgi:hypothetical protein
LIQILFVILEKHQVMTTIELRANFHKLIDNINDENILSKFYDLLSRTNESKEGKLWARLSKEEQEELLIIEKESHDPQNLLPHVEMRKKHGKWL